MTPSDNSPASFQPVRRGFLVRQLFSTDHKAIGLLYLWLALLSVFLGMLLSLLMRIHLVWPSVSTAFFPGLAAGPERYAALTTLHGSLMVFFVLTAAPQAGFGNYFLPLQIGARNVAFPSLNLLSFWMTALSLAGILAAFLLGGGAGITFWIFAVSLFCLAALLNALNLAVTVIDLRADGLSLPRLPLTVWAWFVAALLSLLIFSTLLAACVYLLSDRLLATRFFTASGIIMSGSSAPAAAAAPFLWQRLFWFFAQGEVYIAMLPCLGLTSHLIAVFSRKPVWAERAVVLALCALGVFGFCVWGYHLFSAGLNPFAPLVFATLAESLGLPSLFLVASWMGTLWNARPRLTTSMLFALGSVSLFLSGGLSGIFLARQDLAAAAVSDDFVTGHFHLVMGVAAAFAILAAFFFWFPKMFGRRLDETLGKLHFWLTFAGVYCVFMPMHWLGLMAHVRVGAAAAMPPGAQIRAVITVATLVTVSAQLVFLGNLLWSIGHGSRENVENPWRASTLEWSLASPAPAENFAPGSPVVYRGAYCVDFRNGALEFISQLEEPCRGTAELR